MANWQKHTLSLLMSLVLAACGNGGSEPPAAKVSAPSAEETSAIASDAYVYGFPLAMGYKTLYNYVIDKNSPDYKGPFNKVSCEARLFTPDDKAVVTPNADTPYCMFWLDLRSEPMVLSVPAMEPERFYHFQLVDLYTHNFAYVGSLTTGNDAGQFLLAGPGWSGDAPDGIEQVIQSETKLIFVVVRTQLFGPDDLPRVEEIQQSYDMQPLSAFAGTPAPEAPPVLAFPTWVEGAQFDERSFEYIDFMLQLLAPPSDVEAELRERMATIGLAGNGEFDLDEIPTTVRETLAAGVRDGFADIEQFLLDHADDPLGSAKIFGTRDFLEDSARNNYGYDAPYLIRAAAAHIGLYGNSAAEAIYPSYLTDADGKPYDASKNSYTLTFEEGSLPPVKAFWSLTMYDGKTQLFAANPLERYLLNSTTLDDFAYEDDGSLVLYIGTDSPGEALETNWLPAPDGPFYMVMRLYGPEPAALEGEWIPPQPAVIGKER